MPLFWNYRVFNMSKFEYSIGTTIKFINSVDEGRKGKIVGYKYNRYLVFLPKSTWNGKGNRIYNGVQYTWICEESDFEVLVIPNQQLLFEFMY